MAGRPGTATALDLFHDSPSDIHASLVSEYRLARGLVPPPDGPSDVEIMQTDDYALWLVPVPPLASPPALVTVAPVMTDTGCPPRNFECTGHVRFVNFLAQIISNIASVPTPYAPGMADVYSAALRKAIADGLSNLPSAKADANYSTGALTVRVSDTASISISSFTLSLTQLNQSATVSEPFSGLYMGNQNAHILTLDEVALPVLLGDVAAFEGTTYHEGIHFLSQIVSDFNSSAASPVHPELDVASYAPYRQAFVDAVLPIIDEVLSRLPAGSPAHQVSSASHADVIWTEALNEALAYTEEAIYFAVRAGHGFSRSDVATVRTFMKEAGRWLQDDLDIMRDVIKDRIAEIETNVLPAIQAVSLAFLDMRPSGRFGGGATMNAKIVIDAGHGGHQPAGRSSPLGVVGPRGLLEKDVTLELARRVAAKLGGRAVLTRADDRNVSLAARCAVAHRLGAPVFLSLHADGAGSGRGAKAYVHRRAGEASRALAKALARELVTYGAPGRCGESAELAVLAPDHLPPGAAACLLEVDCLSDPGGEARLGDPRELDRLAASIARGLERYRLGQGIAPALTADTLSVTVDYPTELPRYKSISTSHGINNTYDSTGSVLFDEDSVVFAFENAASTYQTTCSVQLVDDAGNGPLPGGAAEVHVDGGTRAYIRFSRFPRRGDGDEMKSCDYTVRVTNNLARSEGVEVYMTIYV